MNGLPRTIYRVLWVVETIAAVAALDWAGAVSLLVLLFWCAGFGFSLAVGFRHAGSAQVQVQAKQWSDAAAVCGLIFFIVNLLRGEILVGLVFMLLFVVVAQNFLLNQIRHLWIVLAATLVVLISGAAESKNSGFLVLILLYSLGAIFLLIAIEHVRMRRRTQFDLGEAAGATLPTNVALMTLVILLVAGSIFLAMPQFPPANIGAMRSDTSNYYENKDWEKAAGSPQGDPLDRLEADQPPPLNQEFGAAKIPANSGGQGPLPAAADGYGTEASVNYGGFQHQLDIERPGEGQLSNRIVLYLQADEPVYLRMNAFDHFDGLRWNQQLKGLRLFRLKFDELRLLPQAKEREISQFITLATMLNTAIPAAGRPAHLSFPASVVGEDAYGLLRPPQPLQAKTRYTVVSQRSSYRERAVSDAELGERDRYLQLPSALDPRVGTLTAEVTQGLAAPEAAFALEHFLRTTYRYSLATVSSSQGVTPLGEFLFERQAGHCEYFASALAIMLRISGVPSRLVTGFSAGNLNPVTGYYEVRAIDAHAWVEAYLEGVGWVTLEPTPFYRVPETPPLATTATAISNYLDQLARQREALGQTNGNLDLWQALKRLGARLREAALLLGAWVAGMLATLWRELRILLLSLVVVAGGLVAAWLVFRRQILNGWGYLRIRCRPLGSPELTVIRYYLTLEAVLARNGQGRQPAETVEDYLEALHQKGADFAPVKDLGDLFLQVRYGSKRVAAAEALLARGWFLRAFRVHSGLGGRTTMGKATQGEQKER